MITTDKFVFIHMHKTGGQTINHIIEQCVPSVRHIGYHYPYHLLPPECSGLPIVGMVRNPWDWYISWYAFNISLNDVNPLFFIVSDAGQADFKNTLKNLINLGSDTPRNRNYRNALIEMLPESLDGNQGVLRRVTHCVRELYTAHLRGVGVAGNRHDQGGDDLTRPGRKSVTVDGRREIDHRREPGVPDPGVVFYGNLTPWLQESDESTAGVGCADGWRIDYP